MAIDLNDAETQREGSGPIPPGSIVPVRLTLRQADAKHQGHPDPLLSISDSGYVYLDCEFEVLAGAFMGSKFWENLGVDGKTEKQMQGVRIAKRYLRAMVEAARNIQPDDASPQAVNGRMLNAYADLQGMWFGVQVDCKKPRAGDRFVNNILKKIITPNHEFYPQVMNGQDQITDNPVPEIPDAAAPAQGQPAWGAPAPGGQAKPAAAPPAQGQPWGKPAAPAAPPAQGSLAGQAPAPGNGAGRQPAPAWAQRPPAAPAAPPA